MLFYLSLRQVLLSLNQQTNYFNIMKVIKLSNLNAHGYFKLTEKTRRKG